MCRRFNQKPGTLSRVLEEGPANACFTARELALERGDFGFMRRI